MFTTSSVIKLANKSFFKAPLSVNASSICSNVNLSMLYTSFCPCSQLSLQVHYYFGLLLGLHDRYINAKLYVNKKDIQMYAFN
nr:MAG TPA: hypothetical protein [Caudoviricetes sp.]